MHGHTAEIARTAVGIAGNILSFGVFFSPTKTFWRIYKKKSVEEFQYIPYLACFLSCALWIIYGLPIVHPNSTLVITINAAGLTLEVIYIIIYFIYTDNKTRRNLCLWLLGEMAIITTVGVVTMTKFHTYKTRSNFVGIWCVVFVIIQYASPLSAMYNVITTKSVKYMPFLLSLTCFLSTICWVAYATIEFDLFILVGNAIGALLGLAQLILYGCYYNSKSPPQNATENNKKPQHTAETDHQLSATA